jgi:hypothetical protein
MAEDVDPVCARGVAVVNSWAGCVQDPEVVVAVRLSRAVRVIEPRIGVQAGRLVGEDLPPHVTL